MGLDVDIKKVILEECTNLDGAGKEFLDICSYENFYMQAHFSKKLRSSLVILKSEIKKAIKDNNEPQNVTKKAKKALQESRLKNSE